MLQETFGGALFRDPSVGFVQFSDAQKTLAAAIGGGFIGLFSLFNIGGRFFWATLSDSIGRKTTYFAFFVLGVVCYAIAPTLADMNAVAVFAGALCVIAAMYGGGFATVPAYLKRIVCRPKSLPKLWTSCRRPPDSPRVPCEPVSVCNRTGLRPAEREIFSKMRDQRPAPKTRPARIEMAKIVGQRLGHANVTRGNVADSHTLGNNTPETRLRG
jgi:hypothetical protein